MNRSRLQGQRMDGDCTQDHPVGTESLQPRSNVSSVTESCTGVIIMVTKKGESVKYVSVICQF